MNNDRLKNIDNIINKLFPNNNITPEEKANNYIKKYEYLKGFTFIRTDQDFENLKLSYRIRYVNSNGDFRWGGILIKKIKENDEKYLILGNCELKYFTISYDKNYIFFKRIKKRNESLRELFLKSAGFDINNFPIE